MNRVVVSMVAVFASVTLLHSGRTDAQGGHYDRSTGEYHYHHGYPAHDHYDMDGDGNVDCPYKFDDNTIHKNPNSSGNKESAADKTDSNKKAKSKITFNDILEIVFASFVFYIVALFVCELVVIPLIDTLLKKLAKSESMLSDSERFQKALSIAICIVSLAIATFWKLQDKGIL